MANMSAEGKLDQLRGRVRSIWGEITDDDFDRAEGDVERLIGTIKEKTGESVDVIREKLEGLLGQEARR